MIQVEKSCIYIKSKTTYQSHQFITGVLCDRNNRFKLIDLHKTILNEVSVQEAIMLQASG